MTKKRIADLLKEEVEKPVSGAESSAAEPSAETKAQPKRTPSKTAVSKTSARKTSSAKTATAKSSTAQTSSAKAAAAKSTTSKATTSKAAVAKTKAADANITHLTQKIETLEAALIQAESQISALQDDVETHQNRIFELKDSLEKSESGSRAKDADLEKVTVQLKEARQTILKISERQEAEKKQLADAEKQAMTQKVAEKKVAEKKAAEEKAAEEKDAKKKAETQKSGLSVRRPYSSYKSIPEYAIQRGTPMGGQNNSMLNDDDIGWVD